MAAGDRLGRRAFALGSIGPLATLGWAFAHGGRLLDGRDVTAHLDWVPQLGLALDLRLDGFGLVMVALVAGVGALVMAYAPVYVGPDRSDAAPGEPRESAGVGRLAGLLTLFAGAMLGLVVADNLLLLYACWELTSVTSYLLIGNADRDAEARGAALHALLVTGAGGLAMLGGFVVLGEQAGTYRLSEILADPPTGAAVSVALVLVLAGAFTKSAQVPFHSWLPGAMVAPTPISAYLHSAAMVKAGVYVIGRFAPAFADVGVWRPLVAVVGLATMLVGGLRALRRYDLKQLLAFGTVSQLGFLVVLLGWGSPEATVAGVALLLAHAAFKAALFMVVGAVDHGTGTRDLRTLPALGAGWGPTKAVTVVSAASMAGLPPLAGFLAKEEAYDAFAHGGPAEWLVLAGLVAGSVLTVAYSLRFAWAIVRPRPDVPIASASPEAVAAQRAHGAHPPGAALLAPAAVLALLSLAAGFVPGRLSELVDAGANALDGAAHAHLALWHGVNVALVLTAVTVGLGTVAFVLRRPVAKVQAALAPQPSALGAYEGALRGLSRLAEAVTQVALPGSLPLYVSVIVLVAAVVPGVGLVTGERWWPGWPAMVGPAATLPAAALLVGGAVAAALATRRFTAALLLGSVGYGMALLFVIEGAPDLALTQFAVETLSVVLFLLVLRRLPDRFERRSPALGRGARAGVAAVVATFTFTMALAANGARTAEPVSDEMVERSYPDGGGRNVVNVILVDIRGLDTLGEISVLGVAAVGATALARVGRRPRSRPKGRSGTAPDGAPTPAPTADAGPVDAGSHVDVGTDVAAVTREEPS